MGDGETYHCDSCMGEKLRDERQCGNCGMQTRCVGCIPKPKCSACGRLFCMDCGSGDVHCDICNHCWGKLNNQGIAEALTFAKGSTRGQRKKIYAILWRGMNLSQMKLKGTRSKNG